MEIDKSVSKYNFWGTRSHDGIFAGRKPGKKRATSTGISRLVPKLIKKGLRLLNALMTTFLMYSDAR